MTVTDFSASNNNSNNASSLVSLLPNKKGAVLYFHASWHEGCMAITSVIETLAGIMNNDIVFGKIDVDSTTSTNWTETYKVTVVPTILIIDNSGKNIIERIEGADDIPRITRAVQNLNNQQQQQQQPSTTATAVTSTTTTTTTSAADELNERLKRLVSSDQVMVFMKGQPTAPRCGFSRQAVEILNSHSIPFSSFDILTDQTVRQGLKTYSNWPTYPQLYVHGQLIGGLDILKEIVDDHDVTTKSLFKEWNLTSSSSSSTTSANGGTAVAGGDINMTTNEPIPIQERCKNLIHSSKVMLFMKGLPSQPKCGFSRKMVDLLNDTNVAYNTFNILTDESIRQGLKEYSNWPTYPQLYIKGELIGGLDICQELVESNEFMDLLK